MNASGQGRLHFGAGLQGAEDCYRFDRRESEFGRDVGGDANKPDDLDMKFLACGFDRFEISPTVVAQPEFQVYAGRSTP